jgi:hypothetical protein
MHQTKMKSEKENFQEKKEIVKRNQTKEDRLIS